VAEDRRIALAALAVAALVPIATVLATTTHDSKRLYAEQVQVDRAELREVLDDAATSLNVILANFSELSQLVPQLTFGDARRDKALANLARGSRSYIRVSIRLGRHASAAQEMKKALDAAFVVYGGLVRRDKAGESPVQQGRDMEAYIRLSERFVDAAHRAVGSKLEIE
jgi:hypothetical protein